MEGQVANKHASVLSGEYGEPRGRRVKEDDARHTPSPLPSLSREAQEVRGDHVGEDRELVSRLSGEERCLVKGKPVEQRSGRSAGKRPHPRVGRVA